MPEGVSNYAVGGARKSYKGGSAYSPRVKTVSYDMAAEAELSISEYEEENEEIDIFYVVEKMPEYSGGMEAFKKYISDHIQYPEKLRNNKIVGRMFVQFTVDLDGSVIDIKILRGLHPLLDNEVIRVIKHSPKWKPGTQKGKPVKVLLTVPVEFK